MQFPGKNAQPDKFGLAHCTQAVIGGTLSKNACICIQASHIVHKSFLLPEKGMMIKVKVIARH